MAKLYEDLEACADASLEAENRKLQQRLNAQEAIAALEAELDSVRGQLVRPRRSREDRVSPQFPYSLPSLSQGTQAQCISLTTGQQTQFLCIV